MEINSLEKLCRNIGKIKKINKNNDVFGNIEVKIETPRKTLLNIVSDREEFSCYVVKKKFFFDRLIPLENSVGDKKERRFSSLESLVDYLKNNIETIEKRRY